MSPPKRGRSPSLFESGDREGQERSLSRSPVKNRSLISLLPVRRNVTREERQRQQQELIYKMQEELDSDILG